MEQRGVSCAEILNPAAPDVEVRARFLDIGLEQVQALRPPDSVAEARGKGAQRGPLDCWLDNAEVNETCQMDADSGDGNCTITIHRGR